MSSQIRALIFPGTEHTFSLWLETKDPGGRKITAGMFSIQSKELRENKSVFPLIPEKNHASWAALKIDRFIEERQDEILAYLDGGFEISTAVLQDLAIFSDTQDPNLIKINTQLLKKFTRIMGSLSESEKIRFFPLGLEPESSGPNSGQYFYSEQNLPDLKN